uniref:Uncharacterized protein n=1 Tax=Myoviridae sp. ctXwe21 TaxID=2825123 RepID=A0A8S5PYW9_9CAUD|nr:MAG TPA: hypothetical protein [Myoviridae sp. ctXwe21]
MNHYIPVINVYAYYLIHNEYNVCALYITMQI